jgi:dienelactone hydrolase
MPGAPGDRNAAKFPLQMRRWLCCTLIGLFAALAAGWGAGLGAARAEVWDPDAAHRGATIAGDLTFPLNAETIDELAVPRMALIRPTGTGPFPALVLMHQCAGPNAAVAAWARRAVAHGYVVLLVDSLRPRNVGSVCYGPQGGVNFFRGTRDALQAAKHLRRRAYVDRDRIGLVGFSWGGMVGLLAASSHYRHALGFETGFAAIASFYPGCFRITPNGRPPFDLVNPDVAQPLLVLMGDADTETPASECLDKLESLKQSGAPADWHLYQGATHCWDCEQLDGFSKVDARGHHVEYKFRRDLTEDSERRLFDFLTRAMPGRS